MADNKTDKEKAGRLDKVKKYLDDEIIELEGLTAVDDAVDADNLIDDHIRYNRDTTRYNEENQKEKRGRLNGIYVWN